MKSNSQNNKSTAVLDQTTDTPGVTSNKPAAPLPLWSYFPINATIGDIPYVPSLSTPVAALSAGELLQLYCLDHENSIFLLESQGNGPWSAQDLTGETDQFAQALTNIAAVIIGNGQQRVYYLSPDNRIHELRFDGQWKDQEIHDTDGRPIAAAAHSPLVAFTINGLPKVYFVSTGNHVQELDFVDGKGWVNNDVTDQARQNDRDTPDAQPLSSLTGFAISDTDKQLPRVYFVSDANQVWELAWNNGWHSRQVSDQPPAQGQTSLAGMTVKGDPRIYYIGEGNSVHQARYDAVADRWINSDLSAETPQKQRAAAHSPLACVNFGSTPRVYYVGNDASVHEIDLRSAGPVDLNLTSLTGNKFAAGLTPLTATVHNGSLHVIYSSLVANVTGLAQFFSQQP
ncbi:MAG TPA: hypothetical protein VK738_20760 [Terriglobales bacterium]|jgi:hypothetical protein|nr:hypothetical protein [Terriglobales bacterium]